MSSDPLGASAETPKHDEELSVLLSRLDVVQGELPRELNNIVNEFLRELTRPKYTKPLSYDEIVLLFQQLYHDFKLKAEIYVKGTVNMSRVEMKELNSLTTVEDKDEEKVRKYVEMAEYKLTNALHDRLIKKNEQFNSINRYLTAKLEIMKKIKDIDYPSLIDISDVDLQLPIFHKISSEFAQLNTLITPLQKITKIMEIHSQLNTFLKEHLQNDQVSGDYILPLLIYLVIIYDPSEYGPCDFYLNFQYIKNLRNEDLLQSDQLYCLTNLEASLMYIQTLDISNHEYEPLTREEAMIKNQRNLATTNGILSNSGNFLSSAIDTSFKTVMNRLRSPDHTSSGILPDSGAPNDYNPIKNFMGDVMKWTKPVHSRNSSRDFLPSLPNRSRSSSLKSQAQPVLQSIPQNGYPVDLNKYQGRHFQDLTVAELQDLFNDYQRLVRSLQ